jgi:hypothetical protein
MSSTNAAAIRIAIPAINFFPIFPIFDIFDHSFSGLPDGADYTPFFVGWEGKRGIFSQKTIFVDRFLHLA